MFEGRLFGGRSVTGSPSIWISPSSGYSKPAIMRSSVVFPQPEGPSSEKNSPRRMERSTRSTAMTPLKRFVILLILI